MNSSAPWVVGIVGAGEITRRAHLPVLASLPDVKVAWIHDQRSRNARSLGDAYGISAVAAVRPQDLPHCDIALLAVPVNARAPYLEHFASRDTAVLCEKPFAMTAAEHSRLLNLFAPHTLGCGYMRRFFSSVQVLRQVVREAMFGPLLGIQIGEGNRSKGSGADASFLDDPQLGASRGVLADLGSHGVDLCWQVSGAQGFRILSCKREMDGAVDRKVSAHIELTTESASPPIDLHYEVSWLDRQTNQIRLRFARTVVWCDLSVAAQVHAGDPLKPGDSIRLSATDGGATTYNQAFFLEWRHFIDGLKARRESPVSAMSALLTTTLIEGLLSHPDTRP